MVSTRKWKSVSVRRPSNEVIVSSSSTPTASENLRPRQNQATEKSFRSHALRDICAPEVYDGPAMEEHVNSKKHTVPMWHRDKEITTPARERSTKGSKTRRGGGISFGRCSRRGNEETKVVYVCRYTPSGKTYPNSATFLRSVRKIVSITTGLVRKRRRDER